jgi:hypothetical protein
MVRKNRREIIAICLSACLFAGCGANGGDVPAETPATGRVTDTVSIELTAQEAQSIQETCESAAGVPGTNPCLETLQAVAARAAGNPESVVTADCQGTCLTVHQNNTADLSGDLCENPNVKCVQGVSVPPDIAASMLDLEVTAAPPPSESSTKSSAGTTKPNTSTTKPKSTSPVVTSPPQTSATG